ncbi:MAG: TetR family transcriptional regulator [Deltaproteobacteria bacterium]|nr:TetR family transcriptional regulator [Deltaproteobacteria bacterium]
MARPIDNEKRRELARRAVAVLQAEGLDLSFAALAERLELKRPTLLYYFPTKASIIEAALEELLLAQAAFVIPRMEAEAHPLDQLLAQLVSVHAFHQGREDRVVFLSQAVASLGMAGAQRIIDIGNQVFEAQRQVMKGRLQTAIAEGRMHPCDVDALMALLRSTVDGMMVQRFMTGCDVAPVHRFFKERVLDPLRRAPDAEESP